MLRIDQGSGWLGGRRQQFFEFQFGFAQHGRALDGPLHQSKLAAARDRDEKRNLRIPLGQFAAKLVVCGDIIPSYQNRVDVAVKFGDVAIQIAERRAGCDSGRRTFR